MNYYIADTHFGHENVLKFDKRPFRSVDEMDEVLITNWNTVVKDTDDVYIIGDFIYKSKKSAIWYLKRLKGKKHLIQGNHDSFLLKDESLLKEFESIDKMTYTKDGTYTIVLCHFPIAEWNQYWRGSWHIYGHIHNQKKGCFDFMTEKDRALNAGCMINHYAPVTIEQLIENNRTYKKNCWYELCREKKKFIGEREIDDIMSKYCKTALIYHFNIAGKRDHEHSFSAVLRAAYGSKGLFEISEADRQEYSEQELNLLKSLLEKMRERMEKVMYKITLYDRNMPSCTSGVYEIYCDDIDEFEKEWTKLETDKLRIERFRKSKAGEMVTDYYSEAPELNIVQKDENEKFYFEKTVVMYDKNVIVYNAYLFSSELHIDKCEFQIRYVKVWGELLRLVKYKLTGVCREDWLFDGKKEVRCYGNPILKNNILFNGRSGNITDYSKNTVESIAYYPLGTFETEKAMKQDYDDTREEFFAEEELNILFSDILGEAG